MATRKFAYSTGNTEPVIDVELELSDDGTFALERNQHSYDYAVVEWVSGRWEETPGGVRFQITESNSPNPDDAWRAGQVRTATWRGDELIVEGDGLLSSYEMHPRRTA